MVETPTVAEWSGNEVDLTTIQRQLAQLWSRVSSEESAFPVRTSMFNLVVYAGSEETARQVSENLDRLTGRRPSRVVILVSDRMSDRSTIDARVTVKATQSKEMTAPLYGEHLILVARGRAADHLSSVVIPLMLPELPTYLLWPDQPPFGHRVFHRLLAIADQLVVDSSHFRAPGDGFADLARLCKGKQGVHDFQWARLTPWRDMIAQFFDSAEWISYAHGIISIRLDFGSGGSYTSATAGSLLLLGWLSSHLGWEPETTLDDVPTGDVGMAVLQGERVIPIDLHFHSRGEDAQGRLLGVELASQPKGLPPARFTVERSRDLRTAEACIRVHGGAELSRVVPLEQRSDVELLSQELDLGGHDELYDIVVDMASRIAGREVWEPT